MSKLLITLLFCIFCGFLHSQQTSNILWEKIPADNSSPIFRNCIFSSSGKYVITAEPDWVAVYDSQTGKLLNKLNSDSLEKNQSNHFGSLFAFRDSDVICCEAKYYYYILELPSMKIIEKKKDFGFELWDLSADWKYAVVPHYDSLLFPDNNNEFDVFDFQTRELVFHGTAFNSDPDNKNIRDLKFSDDSKYLLATTSHNTDVSIFEISSKKMVWHDDYIPAKSSTSLSSDSKYILLTSSFYNYIYDLKTGELIRKIPHVKDNLTYPVGQFSHDGKYISVLNNSREAAVYNAETGELINFINFSDIIQKLPDLINYPPIQFYNQQISPDDTKLIFSGRGSNYCFDAQTGEPLGLFSTHIKDVLYECGYVFFANNDKYLITMGHYYTIIWEASTGRFIKAFYFGKDRDGTNLFALSPDENCIVYPYRNTIKFFDFIKQEYVKMISVKNDVLHLSFSKNGRNMGYTMEDSSFAVYSFDLDEVVFEGKDQFNLDKERYYGISFTDDDIVAITKTDGDKYTGQGYHRIIYNINNKEILSQYLYGCILFLGNWESYISWTPRWNYVYLKVYFEQDKRYKITKEYITDDNYSCVVNSNYTHFITSGPTIWNIETGDSIELHADPELGDMDYVAVSNDGTMLAALSPEGRIVVWDVSDILTDVDNSKILKGNEHLSCYPNPTSGSVNIRYRLEKPGYTNIFLTDALGNKQEFVSNEYKLPGDYVETFSMDEYTQGMYNVVLDIGGEIFREKIVVIK